MSWLSWWCQVLLSFLSFTKSIMADAIPSWVMSLVQSLPEESQADLLVLGSKAVMDPWFGAMATLPLLVHMAYFPHLLKIAITFSIKKLEYNNLTPRQTDWNKEIKNEYLSKLVHRCTAAHENSLEALIYFAPALLLCRLQKANPKEVRQLAFQFVKMRALFIALYLGGYFRIVAFFRTLVFFQGFKIASHMYVKALMA